jgi:hypothetical protein
LAQCAVSFHLHHFSAPAEHFLGKELSEVFAQIPGGGHGTLLYQRGGAIYIYDGTIVIRDSTFDANSADFVSG